MKKNRSKKSNNFFGMKNWKTAKMSFEEDKDLFYRRYIAQISVKKGYFPTTKKYNLLYIHQIEL